jgi:plasmid stabilization system protein ParE
LAVTRSGPFQVQVTRRAAREIREAADWWLRNRFGAPEAFREELERAFVLLAAQPRIGAVARNEPLAGVRRVLLARVRYHLYYRVVESSRQVQVLALWHASRGSGPGVSAAG